MIIAELFEPGKQWQWSFTGSEEAVAVFHVGEVPYKFYAYAEIGHPGYWNVEFSNATRGRPMGRYAKFGLTGTGNSAEVMSTIADIMREFLKKYKVTTLLFTADEPSRKSLYFRMIKRLLPGWNIGEHDKVIAVSAPKGLDEQVLDETTEQDQIIRIIASKATEKIINIFLGKESNFVNADIALGDVFISRRDRLTWLSGLPLSKLYLPQTNDPVVNAMLGSVKIKMIDGYDRGNPNSLGAYVKYEGGLQVIELYLPAISESEETMGMTAADRIQSVLIHELTHAMDDVKSAGKYSKTHWVKGADDTSPMTKDDDRYQQYLRSNHEINARFLQALLDISINYHHVEGPHRLQDLIKSIFAKHRLDVATDKQMKRLMSRAYMYFDAIQNSPKKAEPKSLAKRAWAWITSGASHEIKEQPVTEEVKKNRWSLLVADQDKHEWADNLIDLVTNAYNSTSLGSFVQNASQVAASDWVALDWDPQPDLDCTVFYRRARPDETWSGHKIQGIGHDGKAESKQRVIKRTKALLNRTGVWIESSDAMARTLGKNGLDPVTDEQLLQRLFPGTNLRMIDNQGRYERDAGGTRIREQVFGKPVVK